MYMGSAKRGRMSLLRDKSTFPFCSFKDCWPARGRIRTVGSDLTGSCKLFMAVSAGVHMLAREVAVQSRSRLKPQISCQSAGVRRSYCMCGCRRGRSCASASREISHYLRGQGHYSITIHWIGVLDNSKVTLRPVTIYTTSHCEEIFSDRATTHHSRRCKTVRGCSRCYLRCLAFPPRTCIA